MGFNSAFKGLNLQSLPPSKHTRLSYKNQSVACNVAEGKNRCFFLTSIRTEHIQLVAWQNVEFASAKAGGICSNHEALDA